MLLQTPDFHASSFTLLQSFCHSLLSLSLSLSSPPIPFSLPPIPSPSTCTIPSSHDYVAIVDRPQVLIIKASPDTPPYGVRPPVRLIPQIWERKEGWGWAWIKRWCQASSSGCFDELTCSQCWQPVFQSSVMSIQTTAKQPVFGF